jgi:2-iminobutanoate/2-iminopropanoate deaminase
LRKARAPDDIRRSQGSRGGWMPGQVQDIVFSEHESSPDRFLPRRASRAEQFMLGACGRRRRRGQGMTAILHGFIPRPTPACPTKRMEKEAMPRSSIYVGEIAHQSPIPNASRIGNIIVSGLIRGHDPATSKLAATLEQQCAFMFMHMRKAVAAAGGTSDDIIKVTVWMEKLQRKPVNDEWGKMFPDPASRPARQIMQAPMEAGVLVQCDFMAVIER